MSGPALDAREAVRVPTSDDVKWDPPPMKSDGVHYPPEVVAILKSKDGGDLQLVQTPETPSGVLQDIRDRTAALPADLQNKMLKGALDATTEFMKDKGGFDYKPTGDPDKDWAAISKVLDGLSLGDQNELMIKVLDSTTKVLHEENEKYKNGPFGDNVRANYLYEKQQRHEPLTEHERNELYGFEEFRDDKILGYLAGRELNHEPLTPQQQRYLDTARRQRDENEHHEKMP